MKKTCISPSTRVLHFLAESMLAASLGLKDELGGEDQLSTDKNDWDAPKWLPMRNKTF